ncbi:MAG TPA: ABC transporter permease [Solirubrobacteraceae bacterium]|nr:ABC transporter permease [Solirubrobacteraceae bacterium]
MAVETGSRPPSTQTPAKGPASGRALATGSLALVKRFLTLREGSVIVITVLTIVYFTITADHFATSGNFKTLLPYFAPFAILAAGEVFLMINGEIDLSIGAVYLAAPFIFYEINHGGVPLIASLILAMLACMIIGLINGIFTAVVGINSFITTLGMLFALSGFTLVISHAQPVDTPGTDVSKVTTFANIFGAGTYSELIWALAIVGVLQIVLTFTRWGLYTVAVGGNRLGAAEAGIKVRLVIVRNFVLCSVCAGLVGVLEAVRTSSVQPDPSGANEVLFDGISAAVIGGTLLLGGSGTVVGGLIGALFLGVLRDGLIIKGVNADYLDLYLGLAIIIAMAANTYVGRVRKGAGVG